MKRPVSLPDCNPSRLYVSVALTAFLCLPVLQTVSAAPAHKKHQHISSKHHQRKPKVASADAEWTARTPSHQEFSDTSSPQTDGQSQTSLKKETLSSTSSNGYPIRSTGTTSVFSQTSDSPSTQILLRPSHMDTDASSEQIYDGTVKSYALGPASFELNYARENDRSLEATRDILNGKRAFGTGQNRFIESPLDRDTWHVGMNYEVGKGSFNAAVDYTRMRSESGSDGSGDDPADLRSITFGYTHNVSENTSFYGSVTHTEYDIGDSTNKTGTAPGEDNINQVNVGIKHRF